MNPREDTKDHQSTQSLAHSSQMRRPLRTSPFLTHLEGSGVYADQVGLLQSVGGLLSGSLTIHCGAQG